MPQEPLITTRELAKELAVSPRTLARYVERGWLIPAITLPSGQYRWNLASVKSQLRAMQEEN